MYEHSRTIFTSRAAARSYVTLRCYDVSLNFVQIVLLYIFDELALNDLESKFGQLGSSTYVEKVEFLIIFEILTRLGIVKRSFTCFCKFPADGLRRQLKIYGPDPLAAV